MTGSAAEDMHAEDSADEAPHLLIVDDDTRLRELLAKFLADQGFRISAARDANEARAQLAAFAFDLIVLDLMMPGENGLDLTLDIRQSSSVPILMLTARGEADDRIAGLEAGVDDYLPKPFEPRELVLRIRTILKRATPPAADPLGIPVVRIGDWLFDTRRGDLRRGDEVVRLTAAEVSLLRLFAAQPGSTFSREELSQRSGAAQERSVDVLINRLRRKLDDDARAPQLLQTVRGKGYVLWPS
jgi:two-component system phosphate regulon response regulator OmpR